MKQIIIEYNKHKNEEEEEEIVPTSSFKYSDLADLTRVVDTIK